MAAPNKRHVPNGQENDNDSGSSDGENMDEEETFIPFENVNMTFEGFTPEDSDFHGIKGLLEKVFGKADINLSRLTEFIISHNYVATLLKQDHDEALEADDSDSDDDMPVLGLITVINLSQHKKEKCISELRNYLLSQAEDSGEGDAGKLSSILDQNCGLILSVQAIIQPTLAVPMWQALSGDVAAARAKGMKYGFANLLVLCRTFRQLDTEDPKTEYSQSEEEALEGICEETWAWPFVAGDTMVDGAWGDADRRLEPRRSLFLLQQHGVTALSQVIAGYVAVNGPQAAS